MDEEPAQPPRTRRPRARRAITPSAAQLADAPEFAPVPRQHETADGWTYERQRAFVQALAATGTVARAAAAVGMTTVGAYRLRRQPGAEGFAKAWADALAIGVERLADVMMERAIHGVAIPIFHRSEQVGERRWYNDRLLMFALRHHDPDRYGRDSGGTASVPPHVRAALRREWEAERAATAESADPNEVRKRILAKIADVRRMFGDHDEEIDGPLADANAGPAAADELPAGPGAPLSLPPPDDDEPSPHRVARDRRRPWAAMGDAGEIGKPKE